MEEVQDSLALDAVEQVTYLITEIPSIFRHNLPFARWGSKFE